MKSERVKLTKQEINTRRKVAKDNKMSKLRSLKEEIEINPFAAQLKRIR